jgi:hypothetical protein
MSNYTAAEKTGSAEHGDGAIGRCRHDFRQFVRDRTAPDVVGRPPLAIVSLLVRPEVRPPHLPG